ncbi:NtaA/DmoA family FMN-dependent monooxygenase [Pseudonocardia pini]|uniref:NtaA/DmoA family FMN-dependent monooxygenase n=1 Tax=Pseudonocardia pini TaxID=2758030 RepID=UPI0015F07C97|nr:NtaA/DmoA family FMN-dependent monooxygenase [Pseudonocardia pini]
MFHLGWFTNPQPNAWAPETGDPWGGRDGEPERWQSGEFYVDMARALDRACFDYLMLEDHVVVTSMHDPVPRLDPVTLVPLLARETTGLGLIATVSTSFTHPFGLARTFSSLDHLTGGRVGWNIVTTSEQSAAQAYGMDRLPPHDERYERADEFVELATQLWDGWEPDAVVATPERYVDPAKVHPVDFEGRWYRSKGLLNSARPPQGRPVICQAGTSDRGREFAARWAETILVAASAEDDIGFMKDIRNDVRARAAAAGRDPDEISVMYMVEPILGETEEIARERKRLRNRPTDEKVHRILTMMTKYGEHDLFAYDLDSPLPPGIDASTSEGHRSTFGNFLRLGRDGTRTLREMCGAYNHDCVELVGTPASVAERMGEVMAAVGGDGFLLYGRPLTRHYITEITEGLVPELQRRGLTRTSYAGRTLREHLRES